MFGEKLKKCMQLCRACGDICEESFYNHCLVEGGAHTESAHARIMADCVDICRTAASAMARGSDMHKVICGACADICQACAESCAALKGDKEMQACAEACHACAIVCREMSGGGHLSDASTLRARRAM